MGNEELEKLIAQAETRELKEQRFWPKPPEEKPQETPDLAGKCKAPLKVVYVVLTNCLVINSGACPQWDFCEPLLGNPRK